MKPTKFSPTIHGFHFDNNFVNPVLFGAFDTYGLCGGMAYCALDYYWNNLPIPTHVPADFGSTQYPPPGSRLYNQIYGRLIDSFTGEAAKWICIYPDLLLVAGAALGATVGGPFGAVFGAIAGGVADLVDRVSADPKSQTTSDLQTLVQQLDAGKPTPIGLAYSWNLGDIAKGHQVVAIGYDPLPNGQFGIYVYDNDYHDQTTYLVIDPAKPDNLTYWLLTGADGTVSTNRTPADTPAWVAMFVQENYKPKFPAYMDLVAGNETVVLTGPTVTRTVMQPVGPYGAGLGGGRPLLPVKVSTQVQTAGAPLTASYQLSNRGDYPAHCTKTGLRIVAPGGAASDALTTGAATPVGSLASGGSVALTYAAKSFGTGGSGTYLLTPEFVSTDGQTWLPLPGYTLSVAVDPPGTTLVPGVAPAPVAPAK
ncbi:MAG TPA: hypothetical protein VGL81_02005 [Polyangiaceae bacterium]|jgi:hypothetical protein